MANILSDVHTVKTINGVPRLMKTRHTSMVSQGGQHVFYREGQLLDETGKVLKDPPEWAFEALARMSPERRKELGFK